MRKKEKIQIKLLATLPVSQRNCTKNYASYYYVLSLYYEFTKQLTYFLQLF